MPHLRGVEGSQIPWSICWGDRMLPSYVGARARGTWTILIWFKTLFKVQIKPCSAPFDSRTDKGDEESDYDSNNGCLNFEAPGV